MTQQTTAERPGIAAAIVVHEGRVLMVRRQVSEGQLSWQFPAGEEREAAAIRETHEETGLTVEAVKLLGEGKGGKPKDKAKAQAKAAEKAKRRKPEK